MYVCVRGCSFCLRRPRFQTLELGDMYGVKPDALGGSSGLRYAEQSAKGLVMKGKKVAEWTV